MKLAALAWRYLWARPLNALLNLLLLALGLASIAFVVLVSEQVENAMQRDLAGIDLVVGAKGSPMQLILAGVFHLDVPPGNIPATAVQTLREQPLVARAVPLALGDSLRGYRIVGTTAEYLELYPTRLQQGRLWQAPLEAVLGAQVARDTGLRVGDSFVGVHGLGGSGHEHGKTPYRVVGLLDEGGGVTDRLVLTAVDSVWAVHEDDTALDDDDRRALEAEREVTMVLVSYRSPLAAASLPRWVNAQADLQAASPALETARLLRIVGVGTDVLRGFGVVLLLAAALSVFIALYHAVREREGDLAMMRMLGAPPRRVGALVAAEALWLALLGTLLGLALAHGLTHVLGWQLQADRSIALTGWWCSPTLAGIPLAAAVLAGVGAALPAWRAMRLDVTRLLQDPR
jgi:putative ABC transport system permease protein